MIDALRIKHAILIIEDEATQRHFLVRHLEKLGFQVFSAENGSSGLEIWSQHRQIRLVITDLAMASGDGFSVVEEIRKQEEHYTYIMVLTTMEDKPTMLRALNCGADDFVNKPILPEELALRLKSAVRQLRLEDQYSLIGALAELAASRSGEVRTHLRRTKEYTRILAHDLCCHAPELALSEDVAEDIANLSVLHDIGMNGLPDGLLNKRGRYTAREFAMMKDHTAIGGEVLKGLYEKTGSHFLLLGHDIAVAHHEKYDGSGYPFGLQGDAIPLGGRIVAMADAYDALLSANRYKDALSCEHAGRIILAERGKHFDPRLVDSFERNRAALEEVHQSIPDEDLF